jgi:hypothetical protein
MPEPHNLGWESNSRYRTDQIKIVMVKPISLPVPSKNCNGYIILGSPPKNCNGYIVPHFWKIGPFLFLRYKQITEGDGL